MILHNIKDQLNRDVVIPIQPKRIVSLVPSQTELLIDLGLENELVGITRFCVHPKRLRKNTPSVGGTKDVRIQRVLSLEPDLIIANKEENDEVQIKELAEQFPVWISDVSNIEDAIQMIQKLSFITNREEKGQQIIDKILKGLSMPTSAFASAIYLIWQDPIMIAGKGTFVDDMIRRSGLENLAPGTRYPQISFEEIEKLAPQVILLSSEPFPFKDSDLKKFQERFPNSHCLLVDGEMFSWYGSRLIKAQAYIKEFSHMLKKRLQNLS